MDRAIPGMRSKSVVPSSAGNGQLHIWFIPYSNFKITIFSYRLKLTLENPQHTIGTTWIPNKAAKYIAVVLYVGVIRVQTRNNSIGVEI